jgi:hypothetical protein
MRRTFTNSVAIVLAVFGLVALFLSSSVIFDLFSVRAKEGNYVLFVVWANFLSSILYLFAAYGFIKTKKMDNSSFRHLSNIAYSSIYWIDYSYQFRWYL